MLEPYEWKRSRTVLRRESGSNPADLVDYGPLVRALGGEVITISASSDQCSYINALDLSAEYGDGKNPLVLKSEFIMSLCEQLMGNQEIGAKEKSIIDRCTANIYREYIKDFKGEPPTLKDLPP